LRIVAPGVSLKPSSERRTVDGPAGRIEVLVEWPASPLRGFVFIGHPHPLYGGNLDNKVAVTLARAFMAMGWVAVRPNFRGVGASTGQHDNGIGETADFLFLIDTIPRWPQWSDLLPDPAGAPVALAGFSFGSFVAAGAARALAQRGRRPLALVLVGAAVGKWPMPAVDAGSIVIHGEVDETIALAHVYPWARACGVGVIVLPGADHFFHRRLTELKRIIVQNVLGAEQAAIVLGAPAGPASGGQENDE
jgi:alpha/beta superfamily hydrolase